MGREPPQLLETRPATEPLGSGLEGLDVDPRPSAWRRSARSPGGWNWPLKLTTMREDYIRAGADVITTNTYSSTRHNY